LYPVEVGHYGETHVKHACDAYVSGIFAYVVDYAMGLQVINVSNPSNPFRVGSIDWPATAWSVSVLGNYAYVAVGDIGLRIVNISDPTDPTEVSYCETPNDAVKVHVAGNYAYVGLGSLSPPYGDLSIVNVTNPLNPQHVTCYDLGMLYAYGVHVSNSYAYVTGWGSREMVYLKLMGGIMADTTFANHVNPINCRKRTFWMQQCFGGGFIDDLAGGTANGQTVPPTVTITASRYDEPATRADGISRYGSPLPENESVGGLRYHHGEFNFHTMNSVREEAIWPYREEGGTPPSVNADANKDLLISMAEVFGYLKFP